MTGTGCTFSQEATNVRPYDTISMRLDAESR